MQPTVLHLWSDDDTQMAALFDDGHRYACDEKAAVLVAPDGTIVKQWWREEPSGEYYDAFELALGYLEPTVFGFGLDPDSDRDDPLTAAIGLAGHYAPENPKAQEGARQLVALLVK